MLCNVSILNFLVFDFCSTSFYCLIFSLCVMCCAPINRDKLLVCENLFGNKPDSDREIHTARAFIFGIH